MGEGGTLTGKPGNGSQRPFGLGEEVGRLFGFAVVLAVADLERELPRVLGGGLEWESNRDPANELLGFRRVAVDQECGESAVADVAQEVGAPRDSLQAITELDNCLVSVLVSEGFADSIERREADSDKGAGRAAVARGLHFGAKLDKERLAPGEPFDLGEIASAVEQGEHFPPVARDSPGSDGGLDVNDDKECEEQDEQEAVDGGWLCRMRSVGEAHSKNPKDKGEKADNATPAKGCVAGDPGETIYSSSCDHRYPSLMEYWRGIQSLLVRVGGDLRIDRLKRIDWLNDSRCSGPKRPGATGDQGTSKSSFMPSAK